MSALVGSETTCETDKQSIGVNLVEQGNHARGVALISQPSVAETFADVFDEFGLQAYTCAPDDIVRYFVNLFPDL